MLYDALTGATGGAESELNEVERELGAPGHQTGGVENGTRRRGGSPTPPSSSSPQPVLTAVTAFVRSIVSPVLLEAFSLTFLAEWGDRSQIATIGLAAASDVAGVTLGGIVGHALCTGAAVMGGKHLAAHIDERLVAIFGGILFLVFGLHSLWSGVPS